MANAMVPLQNITLSSSASSVTFASIPGTYRDLRLVTTTRHTSSTQPFNQLRIRFNGDTGANYNHVRMIGWGSSTESAAASNQTEHAFFFDAPASSSSFAPMITDIMDYAATDKHKSMLTRLNDAEVGVHAIAGRWASTSAITSFVLYPPSDSWVAGSTFALYGVVA